MATFLSASPASLKPASARRGRARYGTDRHDTASHGMASHEMTRYDMAEHYPVFAGQFTACPTTARPVPPGLIIALLLALLTACSVPEPLQIEEGTFTRSDIGKEAFFERYTEQNRIPDALSGRASVQVSEPGQTERASVRFRSDRRRSLLLIRNNLGIEGGRIYSDTDSVVVYNRIEETAHKMSHEDAAWFYLNGIGAMNLIRMLDPLTGPGQIDALYENEAYFLVETTDGGRHILDRDQMVLRRTERRPSHPEAYSSFTFSYHAEIDGYRLPRRIQILSYDEKSNIFLVIRSLETDPSELDFDPGIPPDIELIRL
ncbi:MAG: hypothetical protein ACQETM_06080 [Bacteroidota bacterium]